MVAFRRLKTNKIKLLALEVVAVSYKRWLLTRGSKYSDFTWKLLIQYFGKLVTEERWLLTRGGCNQRFNSKYISLHVLKTVAYY